MNIKFGRKKSKKRKHVKLQNRIKLERGTLFFFGTHPLCHRWEGMRPARTTVNANAKCRCSASRLLNRRRGAGRPPLTFHTSTRGVPPNSSPTPTCSNMQEIRSDAIHHIKIRRWRHRRRRRASGCTPRVHLHTLHAGVLRQIRIRKTKMRLACAACVHTPSLP